MPTDFPGSKPYRVLIIDDEPSTIHLLARTLLDMAHLRFAVRGEDALRILEEGGQDLVLTDADMPDVSGFEIIQAMRSNPRLADVPVIMVTAHQSPELHRHALDLGVTDFLTKPVDREALRQRVSQLLRSREGAASQDTVPVSLLPVTPPAPVAEPEPLLAPVVSAPPAGAAVPVVPGTPTAMASALLDHIATVLESVDRMRSGPGRTEPGSIDSGLTEIEQTCSDMTALVIQLSDRLERAAPH